MSRSTTLQRTIVAALAVGAVATSPAVADRLDSPTSSLAGTTSPGQDLRGEHARDAARAAATPVRPAYPRYAPPMIEPAQVARAAETGSTDHGWLLIGVGLAATAVGAGAAAGVTCSRVRARRVAV
jgi:hypothetical protein